MPDRPATPVADVPIRLVVLLEQPWQEVVDRWRTLPQPAPALDAVLSYALESGTYWGTLALGWLEQGYPITGVIATLARIKDDKRYSQRDRHRALRLWKPTGRTRQHRRHESHAGPPEPATLAG